MGISSCIGVFYDTSGHDRLRDVIKVKMYFVLSFYSHICKSLLMGASHPSQMTFTAGVIAHLSNSFFNNDKCSHHSNAWILPQVYIDPLLFGRI